MHTEFWEKLKKKYVGDFAVNGTVGLLLKRSLKEQ
jgi:hypothetical protein